MRLTGAYRRWQERRRKRRADKLDAADHARQALRDRKPPTGYEGGGPVGLG